MADQQGSANSADDFLWGMVGIIIAIGLIWFGFHTQIAIGLLYVADYKVRFLELFLSSPQGGYLYSLREWINSADPSELSFGSLMTLSKVVGKYFMVPISIILGVWAYRLYHKPTYARKLDTQWLKKSESSLWPEIIPPLMHDILSEDPKKGKWAVSRSPVDFLEHFKLVTSNGDLKEDKARTILTKQLGAPFKGLRSLSKYELALFGCFASAIMKDKDESNLALSLINQSYDGKGIDHAPGAKLAKKYLKDPLIQDLISRHHFKSTLLYAMLQRARESSGVLPSSNFLWLKPLSRHTWYILNNVGRKVAWSDACAVFGHFNAEVLYQKKIEKPFIDKSVEGLIKVTRDRVIKY